jgi:predicted hotdog family 3-hydroxylacyl-ACP dehydratase
MKIDAITLIPHRPPMLMIDCLVESSEGAACAEAALGEGHVGVSEGRVLESALVECVAQTAAAMKALAARRGGNAVAGRGDTAPGLLAGVTAFRVFRRPAAGERLTIRIREDKQLGPMSLVTGRVLCGDEVVAEGQLKVYEGK